MSEETNGRQLALGMMSGTSMDGVDAALIETDGLTVARFGPSLTIPYEPAVRELLGRAVAAAGGGSDSGTHSWKVLEDAAQAITDAHIGAVRVLLARAGVAAGEVGVVGFHGHTVHHDPASGITRQIGDAARLAQATGIDVVSDFRSADVAAGGQGAPFASGYHAALARWLEKPLAVLNLGGVGNVTWIGGAGEAALLAFDTGPGCALMDDWVRARTGAPYDTDGALAAAGTVDAAALAALMADPYFTVVPPKSLDRDQFDVSSVAGLGDADGAATLLAFTVEAVAAGAAMLPAPPRRWVVTGGGRHNPALMRALAARLGVAVQPVEAVGWEGDALEAQAFAWLAVRSLAGLPLSWPGTTGVPSPLTGGRISGAASAD